MNQGLLKKLQEFLELPPYSLSCLDKQALQVPYLEELCVWHREHCPEFAKIAAFQNRYATNEHSALLGSESGSENQAKLALPQELDYAARLHQLPMTPVRLFKEMLLKSVPDEQIYKVMTSSGTTGNVSKIALNRETALWQSKVLSHIMADFLGKARRRMLIVDSKSVLKDPKLFSARGAGIMGMMPFGHHHVYALDEHYEPVLENVVEFLEQHQAEPLLLFGFTFMIWQHLYQLLQSHGIKFQLQDAVLIHAGGWKKMQQVSVDNDTFKQQLNKVLGPNLKVHNFYGMVEQTGSVYLECEAGHLHVSNFSEIIIRDPLTHEVLPWQHNGVIETISLLPMSYPGMSILTEDMGTILGEDDCPCGRKGKYFCVTGRIPRAELRGCSDVYSK